MIIFFITSNIILSCLLLNFPDRIKAPEAPGIFLSVLLSFLIVKSIIDMI